MDGILSFIKEHKDEDLTIYYTPVPELEGIKIAMRRNTAIVTRVLTYWDLFNMLPRMILEMLNDMYSQFSGFKGGH